MVKKTVKNSKDIFSPGPDNSLNACLSFYGSYSDYMYKNGYRRAGKILSEHVIKEGRDMDALVMPIAFLYRHHFELILKIIIRDGSKLFSYGTESIQFNENILKGHDLIKLWRTSKAILTTYYKDDYKKEPEYIDEVDELIRQFNKVDPGSFSFRYPTDKKGLVNIKNITLINIEKLHSQCSELAERLDGMHSVIQETLGTVSADMAYYER